MKLLEFFLDLTRLEDTTHSGVAREGTGGTSPLF